ncbi:MAG: DUF3037 domain-containing protein [Chthoniobacteraceae bacterium]
MKIPYSFVTLRYVHDVVTGEFANVGVVLYAPEQRLLLARFSGSYERLNAIFLKIDHAHFRALMRYLTNRFEELGEDLRDALERRPMGEIQQLVRQVLPPDDSSLQWSEPGGGFTENAEETLRSLYSRLVERYVRGSELQSRTDDEIAKPFKARLERKRVAQLVQPKEITTPDYHYEFPFARRNGMWHVYQPVSFDLVDPDSIVEKGVRWFGRGSALHESNEPFKIHFLLGEPKNRNTRDAFVHAQRLLEKIPGETELIRENDVESFADSVAEDIARHETNAVVREEPPKE